MQITIEQLGYALGARVTGIDLRAPLQPDDRKRLYDAWLKHLVLVFPGQDLTEEELMQFSQSFGELDRHESAPHYRSSTHPEIVLITNRPKDGKPSETRNTGHAWHTDMTFTCRPAKGALLLCKEKPLVGGDTMWANLYLAYESLSRNYRQFVDTLKAIHDVSLIRGFELRDPDKVADMRRLNPPVVHDVVRVHPETGRKSLLVGERIRSFEGMTPEETAPILAFLNAHCASPMFTYRHRWNVGDVVMWDNRCTQHFAIPDYDRTQFRNMWRCSLVGEPAGKVHRTEAETPLDVGAMVAAVA